MECCVARPPGSLILMSPEDPEAVERTRRDTSLLFEVCSSVVLRQQSTRPSQTKHFFFLPPPGVSAVQTHANKSYSKKAIHQGIMGRLGRKQRYPTFKRWNAKSSKIKGAPVRVPSLWARQYNMPLGHLLLLLS